MGTLSTRPVAAALTSDDVIAILQSIAGSTSLRKITGPLLHQWINSLPDSGTLALADKPLLYIAADTAAKTGSVQKALDSINVLTEETSLVTDYSTDDFLIHDTTAKQCQVTRLYRAQTNASPEESGWIQYGVTVRSGPALESFGDRDGWATTGIANATTASAASATQPLCADYATSGVLNNSTVHGNTAALGLFFQRNVWYSMYVNLPQITDCRFFCGMFETRVNRDSGDTTTTQWSDTVGVSIGGCGFRFTTSAGVTDWRWMTGSSGSFSFASTGVTVSAGTMYLLEMRMLDNGNWDVYINKNRVLANQANSAPTGTHMRTTAGISTLAGSAKSWRLAGFATAQKWF